MNRSELKGDLKVMNNTVILSVVLIAVMICAGVACASPQESTSPTVTQVDIIAPTVTTSNDSQDVCAVTVGEWIETLESSGLEYDGSLDSYDDADCADDLLRDAFGQ